MNEEKQFEITLSASECVNFAMQQNDIPLIRDLRLKNIGSSDLGNLKISIKSEPEVIKPIEFLLESLSIGTAAAASDLNPKLQREVLRKQNERELGDLIVEIRSGEKILQSHTQRLEILACNEWPGLRILPELLAAFIMPNNQAISPILSAAGEILKKSPGNSSSITAYQSKDSARALLEAAAIYEALANVRITYINPPASFEQTGQKIRLPDQILSAKLGTCLDLALLYAGCLEQAGLNPLVVLIDGHVFTAVWLKDESFSNAVIKDAAALKKRIDLGEIAAIEATALTGDAQKFQVAWKKGKINLEECLSGRKHFQCALDIKMCRNSGVRPLAFQDEGNMETNASEKSQPVDSVDISDILQKLSPVNGNIGSPQSEAKNPRLEQWKRKLLDLTRRNRLLNFRESKKSLKILCENISALEDALALGEEFSILPDPKVMSSSDPRSAAVHADVSGGIDARARFLNEQLRKRRLHASVTESELASRLLEISRTAKSNLEESGANTLFLALGFLKWYEEGDLNSESMAPIILIPLQIERHSVREGFRISMLDDEARINVTLLQKLKADFGLDIKGLDPLPTDEAGLDVNAILATIRDAVKNCAQWDVLPDVHICILTFTKFLMWVDLEHNIDSFKDSPVAKHLIESHQAPFPVAGTMPEPEKLDEYLNPAELYCPLDADSSQLCAVAASASGNSFVLEGPPGTGKSQTITNLIIHNIAQGRRVLFVSEKAAALNVVQRRLQAAGMAPFCLEMHSSKTTRDEFRRQLQEALSVTGRQSATEWEAEAQKLGELRSYLNGYVQALHSPRKIGKNLYWGINNIVRLRNTKTVSISIDWDQLDRSGFDTLREAAEEFKNQTLSTGNILSHPLKELRCGAWSLAFADELRQAFDNLSKQAARLISTAVKTLDKCKMGTSGWSADDITFAFRFSELILATPEINSVLLKEPQWNDISKDLRSWIKLGQERDAKRSALLENYYDNILEMDIQPLIIMLRELPHAWILKRFFMQYKLRNALKQIRKNPPTKNQWPEIQSELESAQEIQKTSKELKDAANPNRLLSNLWNNGNTDWNKLSAILDWGDAFRNLLKARNEESRLLLIDLAISSREEVPSGFKEFMDEYSKFTELRTNVERLIANEGESLWGNARESNYLEISIEMLSRWIAGLNSLRQWCEYVHIRTKALSLGLNPIIDGVESGSFPASEISDVFEASFANAWVNAIIPQEPLLEHFSGNSHTGKIEKFKALDASLRDLSKEIVISKLASLVPRMTSLHERSKTSEMGKLNRFVRGGRSSIRKIFNECPQALSRLKPCLLMSPLSVSQFLNPDFPPVDLVVFDEASQMPVWDAIGAIARGRQLVVVGDSKQLPPTNFFEKKDSLDTVLAAEDNIEDLESILEECLACQMPSRTLNWHYRSRHESLISFSNKRYYDNNLLTFPSPVIDTNKLGVSWKEVPDGAYDAGKTRTNMAEAKAVVNELVRRLLDPVLSKHSVGIVTFSMTQQALIEDLIEDARQKYPALDPFFDNDAPEPVFIKNLETVQGDERDVILFSICYGPDSNGRVVMNFGPLNNKGGERRLNVAITRARQQLIVFSTIKPEQIDLSRTNATGVIHLKEFLEFARRNSVDLNSEPQEKSAKNPALDEEVIAKLIEKNWKVQSMVGSSEYRIDIAVMHPDMPEKFLLAIEFDGPNYHSAKTARDRDRLRSSVLSGLGWKLHRIWAMDWWLSQEREFERLETVLATAMESAQAKEAELEPIPFQPVLTPEPLKPAGQDIVIEESQEVRNKITYALSNFAPAPFNPENTREMSAQLSLAVENIIKTEAPVSEEQLLRRVSEIFGGTRLTSKMRDTILAHIPRNCQKNRHKGAERFYWPREQNPSDLNFYRVPNPDDGFVRSLPDIAPEELGNAMLQILSSHFSMDRTELERETAAIFGCRRLTTNAKEALDASMKYILEQGFVSLTDDGTVRIERT